MCDNTRKQTNLQEDTEQTGAMKASLQISFCWSDKNWAEESTDTQM